MASRINGLLVARYLIVILSNFFGRGVAMRISSKINVLCLFILLMVPSICFGANWYVDKDAVGSNNGTSWANSWTTFASINWAGMANGDTLYISGGTTSKNYTERMTVGRSYVTIKPGQATPHNGQVIIQPPQGGTPTVTVNAKDYVTISGTGGAGAYGIKIVGDVNTGTCCQGALKIETSGINGIFENLEITAPNGMMDGGCIRYTASQSGVSGSEIRQNWIHDCYQDGIDLATSSLTKASGYGTAISIHHNVVENVHDDHIESTMGGLDIYNNIFRNRIDPVRGHPDGHQLYNSYYRIYNNSYSGFNNATSGNSIIYFEPDGGENMDLNNHQPCCWKVYNNLFYMGNDIKISTSMTGIQLGLGDPRFTSLSDLYIVNNTFIGTVPGASLVLGWGSTPLCSDRISKIYVVNNVFENSSSSDSAWAGLSAGPNPCSVGGGAPASFGSWGSGKSFIIDYNLYSGTGSNQINWNSYASWISSTSTQSHGIHTSSLIPDTTFIPPLSSPVVNKGVDLSTLVGFTTDMVGRSRGTSWDIGAYEYNGEVSPMKIPLSPGSILIQ